MRGYGPSSVPPALSLPGSLRNIGIAKSNANFVGAVASGGRVFLTSNGGTSWTQTAVPTNTA